MGNVSPSLLIGFSVFVVVATAVDLLASRRAGHDNLRSAAWWSVIWFALGLGFTAVVWSQFGISSGQEYLSGYLIERALSLDNLFVFSVLFALFSVAPEKRGELLIAGILLAIVLRGVLIFLGAELLERFVWMTILFGAILIYTGAKMLKASGHVKPPRVVERLANLHPSRRWLSVAAVFTAIALTDIVFAIDSIPAVFAVTNDPYIVLTANVFALLGLRALYVVLDQLADRLPYLPTALALVLVVIGVKMGISHWVHAPTWLSLVLVVGILGGGILASLLRVRATR